MSQNDPVQESQAYRDWLDNEPAPRWLTPQTSTVDPPIYTASVYAGSSATPERVFAGSSIWLEEGRTLVVATGANVIYYVIPDGYSVHVNSETEE